MPIKTFRALLTTGDQITIPLHRAGSNKGFRIHKLQLMPNDIDASTSHESSVQIWKQKQAAAVADIDFSNDALLGAAYYVRSLNPSTPYVSTISEETVVFDSEVVTQDIYVTYKDGQGGQLINYYLELEEVTMSGSEQAVVNFSSALLHGE